MDDSPASKPPMNCCMQFLCICLMCLALLGFWHSGEYLSRCLSISGPLAFLLASVLWTVAWAMISGVVAGTQFLLEKQKERRKAMSLEDSPVRGCIEGCVAVLLIGCVVAAYPTLFIFLLYTVVCIVIVVVKVEWFRWAFLLSIFGVSIFLFFVCLVVANRSVLCKCFGVMISRTRDCFNSCRQTLVRKPWTYDEATNGPPIVWTTTDLSPNELPTYEEASSGLPLPVIHGAFDQGNAAPHTIVIQIEH